MQAKIKRCSQMSEFGEVKNDCIGLISRSCSHLPLEGAFRRASLKEEPADDLPRLSRLPQSHQNLYLRENRLHSLISS